MTLFVVSIYVNLTNPTKSVRKFIYLENQERMGRWKLKENWRIKENPKTQATKLPGGTSLCPSHVTYVKKTDKHHYCTNYVKLSLNTYLEFRLDT